VGYTGFESVNSVGEDALPRAHRCDEVWVLFPNHHRTSKKGASAADAGGSAAPEGGRA